jgi:hypothetical protein
MGDELQERIAKNNLIFREANEKIRATSDEYNDPLEMIPFLCECPRPACMTIVRLTAAQYGDVRADSSHFLTAPGHEEAEAPVGHVVSRTENYVVIEKNI